MSSYILAGVTKLSTVDYPGELAAVLYVPGCNMCCPYCHNRDIALGNTAGVPWDIVKHWLREKTNLTAVVVSGGEPLLPANINLTRAIVECAYRGNLKVKLDTNYTLMSTAVLSWHGWLSYVAVDFKGLEEDYEAFGHTGPLDLDFSWMPREYPQKCELRTTVHKRLLSPEKLRKMKTYIPTGVPWYLQKFRPCACFDMSLNDGENYTSEELGKLAQELGAMTRGCDEWDEITQVEWHVKETVPPLVTAARGEATT